MRVVPLLVGAAATLAVALAAAISSAQTVEGLDLAAIRARAKLDPDTARAFEETVARRGERFRAEADTLAGAARAGQERRARQAAPGRTDAVFDFDAMVAGAGQAAAPDDLPRLIVFASLSMPESALRRLIADTGRAGGVVAFRGFPGNSARRFTAALAKLLPPGDTKAQVGIDPRLFRAFQIEAVPAIVVTATGFDLCDGFDCRTTLPPHDRLAGNVTLEHALATIAEGGGPGAALARVHLARLEARR